MVSRETIYGKRTITIYKPSVKGMEFCRTILEPYEKMFPRKKAVAINGTGNHERKAMIAWKREKSVAIFVPSEHLKVMHSFSFFNYLATTYVYTRGRFIEQEHAWIIHDSPSDQNTLELSLLTAYLASRIVAITTGYPLYKFTNGVVPD